MSRHASAHLHVGLHEARLDHWPGTHFSYSYFFFSLFFIMNFITAKLGLMLPGEADAHVINQVGE